MFVQHKESELPVSAAGEGRQKQGALEVREEGKECQCDGKQNWRDRAPVQSYDKPGEKQNLF